MPGPKTPTEARTWARAALASGSYLTSRHFSERCVARKVTMIDVLAVFGRCRSVEPHSDMPRHGGTCWRAFGPNVDGTMVIGVGFEAYVDHNGNRIILCTVLPPREKR